MAAVTKTVGNVWRIYIKETATNTAIGGEVSGSLSINANTVDMSDKDSLWDEIQTGSKNWSISGEFVRDSAASSEQSKLVTKMLTEQSTEIGVVIARIGDASKVIEGYEGKAVITSIEQTFGKNEASKINVSFQGNGALTVMTPTV